MMQKCPLRSSQDLEDFSGDTHRTYYRCQNCALIFVDHAHLLSTEDEKARYELHQNSLRDAGYRAVLARLTTPLARCLGNPPLNGLDFGCGPGPVLPLMMEEMG